MLQLSFLRMGFILPVSSPLKNPTLNIPCRFYAARKGYREKKRKLKVKKVVEKVGFIPHNQRNLEAQLAARQSLKFDDSKKGWPTDDVFVMKYYRWIIYPFAEAVKCHRETHHPDMYNVPNANLHVKIELNMQAEKITRFVENFTRLVPIEHGFDHGETRMIGAFSKDVDEVKAALDVGAQMAGGVELIKQIQNGSITVQDYDYFIASPNILPELVTLRGLMRKRFPNPRNGTLNAEVAETVKGYLKGINYTAARDEHEKDFGLIDTVIGTLDMEIPKLEENFAALIRDIDEMRPKRPGPFITRCLLYSPPSRETLKVDHNLYLDTPDVDENVVEAAEDEQIMQDELKL